MNRYYIQYHSRTLAALVGRNEQQTLPLSGWIFDFPINEVKVVLFDAIKQTDRVNLHTGLNITADIKADSEEEAIEISRNHVEALLSLICFSSLTHCAPAKLVSVINLTDKEVHPCKFYVYPFDGQEIIGSLTVIDESNFGKIFEAYDKSTYKPRILRALTWLRKGIGEENTIDEFVSYWIGLEVIKHIISPVETNTDEEWEKVEGIFADKLHFQGFKKIKQAGRNGLLHGFRQLDEKFAKEIDSYIEPIRKTLIFCIGDTLGLEDNNLLSIINRIPKRIRWNPWAIMKGGLRNLPLEFHELVAGYPTIDAEIIDKDFSINQKGELTLKYKIKHRFHSTGDAELKLRETELWGSKDIDIQQLTLGEVHVDKAKKPS
jgi:uncharacterized protein YrzB (UPF0473 family)